MKIIIILALLTASLHIHSALAQSPIGNFEASYSVGGGLAVKGWAIDQDTTDSIYIWVTIDGAGQHVYANTLRADVGTAYPGYGNYHGFSQNLTAAPGLHNVCVTASNVAAGAHKQLGCKNVTVIAGSPRGNFEYAAGVKGGIDITGWALDPDTTASIYMWVTVDGNGQHIFANASRTDIGAQFPGYGNNHGFSSVVAAAVGKRTICVTASNVSSGNHTELGCREIVVPDGTPFGELENVVGKTSSIEITGWAIDPDTADPIYTWVTINGVGRHVYANISRADVATGYPQYGDRHGFSDAFSATNGFHRVCVTASNVGNGRHKELGCRTVAVGTIPGGTPFGNFESISREGNSIKVKGWSLDPDTPNSIYVWVTIDGVGQHIFANENRPDVGNAYPGYGPNHGFDKALTTSAGYHRVCLTASNVGVGSHKDLGCRDIGEIPSGGTIPDSGWTKPIAGYRATQEFKGSSVHNGIDLAKGYGSTVYAARAGRIKAIISGYCKTGVYCTNLGSGWALDPIYKMSGDKVVIQHRDGMHSVYDHCGKISGIYVGQNVEQDQPICVINQTGNRTGAHLHFGIFTGSTSSTAVNPRNYVAL